MFNLYPFNSMLFIQPNIIAAVSSEGFTEINKRANKQTDCTRQRPLPLYPPLG